MKVVSLEEGEMYIANDYAEFIELQGRIDPIGFATDGVVVTKDEKYKIHYFRKLMEVTQQTLAMAQRDILGELKAQGWRVYEDNNERFNTTLIKEKNFIVKDKELNEIIGKAVEERDQSELSLKNESLTELAESLNHDVTKYYKSVILLDELTRQSIEIMEELRDIPWYKRLFGWKKKVSSHISYMDKELNKVF